MPVNGSLREPCAGIGQVVADDDGTRFGNAICPECRGIAPIKDNPDSDGTTFYDRFVIDDHTVKVIDC